MSWTTLLRMELQELFRISRMTSTKLDSSKTSNLKRLMESNRELNSEIKQRDLLILSMNQANFNMRENLPNRQEKSLWVSNLQVACLMKVKITQAEEVLQNLLLHLLEITVNMVVLVAKILRDSGTIILSNLEIRESMIHTQRQRVSQPILQQSRKKRRRILQSMIVAQNPVTLMQTVTIQKFREKRRRSKRRRLRRRL